MRFFCFLWKRSWSKDYSVEKISETLSDPHAKLYFLFLDFVLPKVTEINQYFQSEKVIIGDVYDKMELMYKELLYCFLKRLYVDKTDLWEIEPENENEFFGLNSLYLGVKILQELSKKDKFQPH